MHQTWSCGAQCSRICAATQKGVAALHLHQLQCKCRCILVDSILLCQHKLIMSRKSIEHIMPAYIIGTNHQHIPVINKTYYYIKINTCFAQDCEISVNLWYDDFVKPKLQMQQKGIQSVDTCKYMNY